MPSSNYVISPPLARALALLGLLSSFSACSSNDSGDNGARGGASGASGASGSSGASSSGGSSGSSSASGGCGATAANQTLHGDFKATFQPPLLGAPAYTKFDGQFYPAPFPPSLVLKLDREQGGCQLMVPATPFCENDCVSGVCTADNVCTPYPPAAYVGAAKVSGLGPTELTIDPEPCAFSYQPPSALPNPPCAEGATVSITTDQFSVSGTCIADIELLGPNPLPIASGKSLPLSWKPPTVKKDARIMIHLDIAHHGGKTGEINCDVPDTGSFEIPEPLVTRLVSLGLAGFPTVEVTRYARSISDKHSDVGLVLSAFASRDLDSGVLSCFDDSECPDGKTCATDLTCK